MDKVYLAGLTELADHLNSKLMEVLNISGIEAKTAFRSQKICRFLPMLMVDQPSCASILMVEEEVFLT